ncbi:fructose-bisphosphate aldolase class-II [Colletotrichum scovillei]|nr:fructose-bisphosphate aldolase class-II [Colletotrichum scovillei]
MSSWAESKSQNRSLQILQAATEGRYGVLSVVIYNIEHLTAVVRAAEAKKSPMLILLFPLTVKQLPTLPWAVAVAIKSAKVPLALHLDHAQDEQQIRDIAGTLPFDSIMVDMSHYDHEENLAKTKVLTRVCHDHSIAVEAESGRINGGEDGIADTGDLEALFTSPEEVEDFIDAEIDLLAPSIGNIHGDYGPKGPQLDYQRLTNVNKQINNRVLMALHGTNDFSPEIMRKCIDNGAIKLNVNKLLLEVWNVHLRENANKPLTQLMEDGMNILQKETERWIDICGSAAHFVLGQLQRAFEETCYLIRHCWKCVSDQFSTLSSTSRPVQILQMTTLNPGTGAARASKREALHLCNERLGHWLGDEDGPLTLSAMAIGGSARRQRALAEVDGMFAGLTYLNKVGDSQEDIRYDSTFPGFSWTLEESILHSDITDLDLEELGAKCAKEEIRTNEIRRAWSGLRDLRKGLEQQHYQLRGVAFEEENSTKIQELLLNNYTSPRRMGEIGILAYRDVLDFVVPDTLAEVVAFASVSYVISNLLLQRGRIAETDVLSGLQRWGGCISNEMDRHTFALLASKMWPLEHLRTADDIEKRSGQDDDQDSHYLRAKRSRLEDDDAPLPLGFQPFQSIAGQGSSSKEMRDAALLTSQGLEMLSEKSPIAACNQQHSVDIENFGGDVMNITDQTSEEYDFSQLLSLLGDTSGAVGGPGQHNDSLCPSGLDPKSSDYYWTGLSLDHIPSQTFSPMDDPHIRQQSPPPAEGCPSFSTDDPAEVIEPGREHEKFIRWIYGSSSFYPSRTKASTQPGTETRQEQFPSAKQDA